MDILDTLTLYPPYCPHGIRWRYIVKMSGEWWDVDCEPCSKFKTETWYE